MPPRKRNKDILSEDELAELLATMEYVKTKKAKIEKEYNDLRDQITPHMEGQIRFVNEAGDKMYAIPVRADDIVFDVEELAEEVDEDTFAEVIKVSIDRDAFKRAVAAERISPATVAKVTKLKPKATSIRFSDEPFKDEDSMTVDFRDGE